MSYLNETHLEVFAANPKAGGAVKIKRADLRVLSKPSSTKNVPGKGSKSTLRSAAKKPSKVTIRTTATTGTFESRL